MTVSNEPKTYRRTVGGLSSGNRAAPWWVNLVVLLGALLMAAGGVIALLNPAMLASPNDSINGAVHVYAGYLASRNLSLAAMLLVLIAMRSTRALGNLVLLTAFVQLADAAVDCAEGRWPIVPGVLVLGLLLFLAAAKLSGHPFWKAAAWR